MTNPSSTGERAGLTIRALSIQDFCRQYGVGRTKVYEELKACRLNAKKVGKRTLILEAEAERWFRSLPPLTDKWLGVVAND